MTPTSRALAIQDHAQELAKLAENEQAESKLLIGAVRRIGAALSDPIHADDPHLRIDQATKLINQTLKAWQARHP